MTRIEPKPALPLSETEIPTKPFAVFVHVFYPDVWARIVERLEATVEDPFHLVLTAPHALAPNLPLPAERLLVSSTIIPCDNRGRDVRPFCEALRLAIDFDVGLKLHTKRSLHRLDGGDWGQTLVEALLPGEGDVRRLHQSMTRDRRLVLAAPDGMLVSQRDWMQGNRASMQVLGTRFALDLDPSLQQTPVFAAGTMFWFRKEALRLLIDVPLDDLFEAEAGQVDGTAAHALERWIAPIAERGGGVATTVSGVLAAVDMPDDDFGERSIIGRSAQSVSCSAWFFWKIAGSKSYAAKELYKPADDLAAANKAMAAS